TAPARSGKESEEHCFSPLGRGPGESGRRWGALHPSPPTPLPSGARGARGDCATFSVGTPMRYRLLLTLGHEAAKAAWACIARHGMGASIRAGITSARWSFREPATAAPALS